MFEKEKEVLKKIGDILSKDERIMKIIAFGSRVRGDFREDSDLDVLVVITRKDREIKEMIMDAFYEYELKEEIPFSVIILSEEEFGFNENLGSPFIKQIKEEGVVIYDINNRRKESPLKVSH